MIIIIRVSLKGGGGVGVPLREGVGVPERGLEYLSNKGLEYLINKRRGSSCNEHRDVCMSVRTACLGEYRALGRWINGEMGVWSTWERGGEYREVGGRL